MRAYERLLNYVKVYTTSEDEQENVPSTSRQFDLGNQLAEELHGQAVKTPPFHGGNRGSNPLGVIM